LLNYALIAGGKWSASWLEDDFIGKTSNSIAYDVNTIWIGVVTRYAFRQALVSAARNPVATDVLRNQQALRIPPIDCVCWLFAGSASICQRVMKTVVYLEPAAFAAKPMRCHRNSDQHPPGGMYPATTPNPVHQCKWLAEQRAKWLVQEKVSRCVMSRQRHLRRHKTRLQR
jgi:hypothetical protein